MAALFTVSEIGFFSLEHWPITVCAWRGCCIEVFARAEHSVADCLEHLAQAGLKLGRDAAHQGAVARLRALDDCLGRYTFSGHEKHARKHIAEWQKLCEKRTYLAHAKLKATKTGITINHLDFAKREVASPVALTRVAMLELLAELEEGQRLLHSHLGQIKAHAARASLHPDQARD
ncbi:MAG: hypothetical protein ABS48_01150 [Erythrobacter sp. SCN 68-10]|nr:MAG: hypothetical protein ABS48_01150 [Erythrobacter sp. SCN 68-10]